MIDIFNQVNGLLESKFIVREIRYDFQPRVSSIYLTVAHHRLNKEMSTAKASSKVRLVRSEKRHFAQESQKEYAWFHQVHTS